MRHHDAVKHILDLWKAVNSLLTESSSRSSATVVDVDSKRVSEGGAGASSGDKGGSRRLLTTSTARITACIGMIVEAREKADADYSKLLLRYPNAIILLRSYQAFAADVLCDPTLSKMIAARAAELERRKEQSTVSQGGDDAASKPSSSTYSTAAIARRNMSPASQPAGLRAIIDMKRKMQLALISLVLLAGIVFALSLVTLGSYTTRVNIIKDASTRRYDIVALAFHTRTLVLSAGTIVKSGYDPSVMCSPTQLCTDMFVEARQETIRYALNMQSLNAALFEPGNTISMTPKVTELYGEDKITGLVVLIGPPAVNTTRRFGLQTMLTKYAGDSLACAQMSLSQLAACAQHFCIEPVIWRFIQDNWVTMLEYVNIISNVYVDDAFETAYQFGAMAFTLLCVVILVLLGSWSLVFWPATMAVQRSNASVLSIATAVPPSAVSAIMKRYTRLEAQLSQLLYQFQDNEEEGDAASKAGSKILEDEEDRMSMGSIHHEEDREDGHVGGNDYDGEQVRKGMRAPMFSSPKERRMSSEKDKCVSSFSATLVSASDGEKELDSGSKLAVPIPAALPQKLAPLVAKWRSRAAVNIAASQARSSSAMSGIGEAIRQAEDLQRKGHAAENVLDMMLNENEDFALSLRTGDAARRGSKTRRSSASRSAQPAPPVAPACAPRVPPSADLPQAQGKRLAPTRVQKQGSSVSITDPAPPSSKPPSIRATTSLPLVPEEQGVWPTSPTDGILDSLLFSGEPLPATGGGATADPVTSRSHVPSSKVRVTVSTDEGVSDHDAGAPSPRPVTATARSAQKSGVRDSQSVSGTPIVLSTKRPSSLAQSTKQASSGDIDPSAKGRDAPDGGLMMASPRPDASVKSIRKKSRASTPVSFSTDVSQRVLPAPESQGPPPLFCCSRRVPAKLTAWIRATVRPVQLMVESFRVLLFQGPDVLSPVLRGVAVRVGVALLLIFGLHALSVSLSFAQVLDGAYTSSAINTAGYRRELAFTTTFHARELVVGPDIIGTYAFAVDTMRAYSLRLHKYHIGLLFGSASLRLRPTIGSDPLQDELITSSSGSLLSSYESLQSGSQIALVRAGEGVRGANITEKDALTAQVASMGLHYLVIRYKELCSDFLARYEPWLASYTPQNAAFVRERYGMDLAASIEEGKKYLNPEDGVDYRKSVRHNMTKIAQDHLYAVMEDVSRRLLDDRLLKSLELYLRQVLANFNYSTLLQAIVIVLDLTVIVALYFGVFRSLFQNLAAEAQRTHELVRLIPRAVISGDSKLRSIISSVVGTAAVKAESMKTTMED